MRRYRSGREIDGFVAVACGAGLMLAAGVRAADIEGSRDHPLLSRVPGSEIVAWEEKEFDAYTLIVGEGVDAREGFAATRRVEGKVTRLAYRVPGDRSATEVSRSYQQAVEQAGFETVFAWEWFNDNTFFMEFNELPGEAKLALGENADLNRRGDARYFVGRLRRPEGDVHAAVYAYRQLGRVEPIVRLRVVEERAMEGGLVVADADSLADDLERSGHVAVYGITFETDSAEIRPESEAAIAEMVKLLTGQPALEVFVVGHTDTTGSLAHNLDLSRRRAEALVSALAARGIAAGRLEGHGIGPLAPVASNATEEGRARNRRVELVAAGEERNR